MLFRSGQEAHEALPTRPQVRPLRIPPHQEQYLSFRQPQREGRGQVLSMEIQVVFRFNVQHEATAQVGALYVQFAITSAGASCIPVPVPIPEIFIEASGNDKPPDEHSAVKVAYALQPCKDFCTCSDHAIPLSAGPACRSLQCIVLTAVAPEPGVERN